MVQLHALVRQPGLLVADERDDDQHQRVGGQLGDPGVAVDLGDHRFGLAVGLVEVGRLRMPPAFEGALPSFDEVFDRFGRKVGQVEVRNLTGQRDVAVWPRSDDDAGGRMAADEFVNRLHDGRALFEFRRFIHAVEEQQRAPGGQLLREGLPESFAAAINHHPVNEFAQRRALMAHAGVGETRERHDHRRQLFGVIESLLHRIGSFGAFEREEAGQGALAHAGAADDHGVAGGFEHLADWNARVFLRFADDCLQPAPAFAGEQTVLFFQTHPHLTRQRLVVEQVFQQQPLAVA